MGLLAHALRPRAETSWGPLDERWYQNLGSVTEAGVLLDAESVLRCGTVLAAVRFLADAWAMCPPQTFIKDARGRREDPQHYSQVVLRDPNAWQTGFRWRHVLMMWAATWGDAYAEIVPGPRAVVGELRPIHPSRLRVLDQRADGTLVYEYSPEQLGTKQRWGQDRVLHFRGPSMDGIAGLKMYQLIRDAVGIALAAERHIGAFLRKGSRLSGLLVPAAPLSQEQRDDLRASVNRDLGGAQNTGSFGVMPFGVDVKQIAANNRESQLMEMTDSQVGSILRFLGVPGVVVGYGEKTATYASAKEFFESGGIKHCVLPWVTNFEQEEQKALIPRGDPHYIRHNMDALLRGSLVDRYASYQKAVGRPWMTANEAREIEDFNPSEDPEDDAIAHPSNMAPPDPVPDPQNNPPPPQHRGPPAPAPDDGSSALADRAYQFAADAAARVVRREQERIRRAAAHRNAQDPAKWRRWLEDHYREHAAFVAEALHIPPAVAAAYCEQQAAQLLEKGLAACESWEETLVPHLAAIAMGETTC